MQKIVDYIISRCGTKLIPMGGVIFLMMFLECTKQEKNHITIAVAANMQFAMQEISKNFTAQTGIPCKLVIASSGKLTAQILEGAPFDVFVAANRTYPTKVYKNELAIYPPKIYGYGQLVLWSMIDSIQPSIALLSDSSDSSITHIAMANPITAPYGEAALQSLQHYELDTVLQHKLVYGESIAQTNQFIVSKSSEIGFTAKSVVVSPKMKNKGNWIPIDKNTHQPIYQAVVLLKRKNQNKGSAQKFYDFLFSTETKEILEDFGYLTP